jgi:SNF2 family DNA or RNA helicase
MRVTKDEVLPELPKKIYEKRFYELEGAQRSRYDMLLDKMKLELQDNNVTILHKMTLYLRLQQLICGYLTGDDGKTIQFYGRPLDNPRIQLLLETLEDIDGQVIIWARFKEDIRQIADVLGDDAVTYYGDTKDREENLRAFRAGEKRFFVGNAVVGGIGLNLVNSACVIYYSNTFSYEDRKQSEDRCHRIGQEHDSVLYIDLEAVDTVDTKIIGSLHAKEDLAMYMAAIGNWSV